MWNVLYMEKRHAHSIHVSYAIVLMLVKCLNHFDPSFAFLNDRQFAWFGLLSNVFWHFSWFFDNRNAMLFCFHHIIQHRGQILIIFLLLYWLANPTFVWFEYFYWIQGSNYWLHFLLWPKSSVAESSNNFASNVV